MLDERKKSGILTPVKQARQAAETTTLLVAFLFFFELLEIVLRTNFNHLGIMPRTIVGLRGIIFSPFLHFNAAHLLANAVSLWVLLFLLFWERTYRPTEVLLTIWLFSGLGAWLIGRPAVHIGASSIVYGLATYLLFAAYWIRSWRTLLIALLTFVLYGGIFHGALPQGGAVSWEGHLSGAIAGFWSARKAHKKKSRA